METLIRGVSATDSRDKGSQFGPRVFVGFPCSTEEVIDTVRNSQAS